VFGAGLAAVALEQCEGDEVAGGSPEGGERVFRCCRGYGFALAERLCERHELDDAARGAHPSPRITHNWGRAARGCGGICTMRAEFSEADCGAAAGDFRKPDSMSPTIVALAPDDFGKLDQPDAAIASCSGR